MATRTKGRKGAGDAVDAFIEAALGLPEIPNHVTLREQDRPFWEGIARARARDEWGDADIVVGVQLARCQADIEAEQKALDGESTVVHNGKGTMLPNPRLSVLDMLKRSQMALMRTLRMGGAAAGRAEDQVPRRLAARAAADLREEMPDDGLLAR